MVPLFVCSLIRKNAWEWLFLSLIYGFSKCMVMGQEMDGKVWGLVYNSVGSLRAEPTHASEMVTQVLLGMPVRIVEQKGEWRRIKTGGLWGMDQWGSSADN